MKRRQPFSRKFTGAAFGAAALLALGSFTTVQAYGPEGQPEEARPAMPGTPGSPGAATPSPEVMQELVAIRQELNDLQARLQEIQQEAMADPGVVEKQAEYEAALDQAIVGQDPGIREKVEQRNALLDELQAHPEVVNPENGQSPEVQAKIDEFRGLEQEIAPMRQVANEEPAVQEKREALETALIEEMSTIDPETPQLLDKRMELAQRFQQLQHGLQGR